MGVEMASKKSEENHQEGKENHQEGEKDDQESEEKIAAADGIKQSPGVGGG